MISRRWRNSTMVTHREVRRISKFYARDLEVDDPEALPQP
jgi:hypothetical protein